MKYSLLLLFIIVITKSIYAQEITMPKNYFGAEGHKFYLGEKRIKKKEVKLLISQIPPAKLVWDKSINEHWISSASLLVSFGCFIGGSAMFVGGSLGNSKDEVRKSSYLLISSVASYVCGLVFYKKSIRHKKEAISIYNDQMFSSGFYISPSKEGLGVCLNF